MGTLEVVAYALGYSAAVELAFMLFTEGPDEAVDPVIMGLAAAALSTMSAPKIDLNGVGSIVLYVIALAGMFAIRRYFLALGERKPKSRSDYY